MRDYARILIDHQFKNETHPDILAKIKTVHQSDVVGNLNYINLDNLYCKNHSDYGEFTPPLSYHDLLRVTAETDSP